MWEGGRNKGGGAEGRPSSFSGVQEVLPLPHALHPEESGLNA